MKYKYHIPIDPNPDCFVQIGELATRWGWIENQNTVLIRLLLRMTKPESHMAIANMGIQAKLGVLRSLASYLFDGKPLRDEIKALAKQIQGFDEFRNDVIHGLWVHYPQGTKQLALLRRNSLEQKVDPQPDTDAVTQLATRIGELKKIQAEARRITDVLKGK